MKSGIYKITCTANGRFYVGSAVDLAKRKRDHFSYLKRGTHGNQHLQNAYNKYGRKAFKFAVLEHVADVEALIDREQHYIDTLEPEFNICKVAGSQLGVKRTEEVRAKMSKAVKRLWQDETRRENRSKISKQLWQDETYREVVSKASRERWQDETYREKISKAIKEQWQDEAHREKISKAMKERWQDEVYREQVSKASKVRWQDDEYREKMRTTLRATNQQRQKPVEQVCKDTGKRIALFPSLSDAARQTGVNSGNVSSVCNGKLKTAGGYIWRYVENGT